MNRRQFLKLGTLSTVSIFAVTSIWSSFIQKFFNKNAATLEALVKYPNTEWTHVAIARRTTGSVNFYLNGIEVPESVFIAKIPTIRLPEDISKGTVKIEDCITGDFNFNKKNTSLAVNELHIKDFS